MGAGIGPCRRPEPAKRLENRAFWGLGRGRGMGHSSALQATAPWVGAFEQPGEKLGVSDFK
jgi:hypothetical protein